MLNRRALLIAASIGGLFSPAVAWARTFRVRLVGHTALMLRGGPVAIPSYQIVFFTEQQATAKAGETISRSSFNLVGVPEAAMRRLADEAHADLVAQLATAGVAQVPQPQTAAALTASGVELAPDNADLTSIGPDITSEKRIFTSLRKAYAAYGAPAAPLIKGLHAPEGKSLPFRESPSLLAKLAFMARAQKSILVMPSLNIDFGQVSVTAFNDFGGSGAGAEGVMSFGIAPFSEALLVSIPPGGKRVSDGAMRIQRPSWNYAYYEDFTKKREPGTVIVNLPVWESLVRQAYTDFNGAIALEFRRSWRPTA